MENLERLFDSIAKNNCILFLGAGASVTSKHKYLSKDLIDFYTDIANIPYDQHDYDIVDFVDKVFSIPDYDRRDFDLRVSNWLGKNLKVEDYHKKNILIPWKLIITTNIDTLIESSINDNKIEDSFDVLRNLKEFNEKINISTKTKIVKLHGCISNIGDYPILFSTEEFENNGRFYDKIYSLLNQFSENISILFVGYSFSDRFGKLFLNKFQNYLVGRKHYLISPEIDTSEFNLRFLASKKITPFKMSFESFVSEYYEWYDRNKINYLKGTKNRYLLPDNTKITDHLSSQLEPFIIPINNNYNHEKINPIQFYLGKEPNYLVIKDNLDVIKHDKINETKGQILKILERKELECSIVFLKGAYGAGKSTFSYRLIKEIVTENNNILAFEIIDYNKINITLIKSLIEQLHDVSGIIIYSDFSDLEFNFKKIRELRGELNAEQYEDKNIILLQSIRENRLESFKRKFNIKKIDEIDINSKFNYEELEELLTKLSLRQVIKLKDEKSKQNLINDILIDQELDNPLTIFLKIIKNGNHSKYILSAYNEFENSDTKNAFKFTCLLYQYGIKMPLGTLKNLISSNFEEFKNNVLNSDGKGIFIQEEIKNDGYLLPDLYFKVKHKILAQSFVQSFYKKESSLFEDLQKIVRNLSTDSYSIKLFVSLIKELIIEKRLDENKINNLFEIAYKQIGLEQQFLVYFTKNLQNRNYNKIKNLNRAIDLIDDYELINYSDLGFFKRNEYLIHRKACLKVDLAKQLYKENNPYYINEYEEAIELFDIKLSLAPNSIFSYRNYLKALLWYDEIVDDKFEKLTNEIKVYQLINKAIDNLDENGDEIIRLQKMYKRSIDERSLLLRIESLYNEIETRPYSILMKIEYLKTKGEIIDQEIIEEIENYSYLDEVSQFLFYYKGHRLYDSNIRMEFFQLVKANKSLINKNKIDYLYFSFIAEIYNRNLSTAFSYQKDIRRLFPSARLQNPLYFIDFETEEKLIFTGKLIWQGSYYNLQLITHGRFLNARINNKKYNYEHLKDVDIKAYLYFDYTGLWAELILEK